MRGGGCAGLALVCSLFLAAPAGAEVYVIPSGLVGTAPDGLCSLTEALSAANTDTANANCLKGTGDDTIELQGGSYSTPTQLTVGDPTVTDDTKITRATAAPVTITGNNASRVIFIQGTTGGATIDGLTITGGLINNAVGSGISTSTMTRLDLLNSTVTGNTLTGSVSDGAGVSIASNTIGTLTNDTITANMAPDHGGGVYSDGTLHLINDTITGNASDTDAAMNPGGTGGGVARLAGTATVHNTIIAGNSSSVGPDCAGLNGASGGGNVVGDATGCGWMTGPGDLLGTTATPVNPLLGGLTHNGGPTQTRAIDMSSPAFGRGVAPCPATDQRGISRPSAGNCDSGAFEFGVVVAAPLACTTKSLVVGPTTGNCPAGSLPLVKKKCKRKKRHAAASKKRCKKKHKRR